MDSSRRRILAIGMLVLVALFAGSLAQAAANGSGHGPRPRLLKTKLTLKADPSKVATAGESVTLTGRLSTEATASVDADDDAASGAPVFAASAVTVACEDSNDTTPLAGADVVLFKSLDRGGSWSRVATLTTGADGSYTATQVIDAKTWFGAWFPGDSIHAATCSPPVQVQITGGGGHRGGVYRFRHRKIGCYLWTASESEKDAIVSSLSKTWALEGVAYEVNSDNPANSAVLYRFRNLKGGHYLYTSSEAEKNSIVSNLKGTWVLEGAAYAVSNDPSGAPVWRFRNLKDGTYLLSGSAGEKTTIEKQLKATWKLEGVAFYVAP